MVVVKVVTDSACTIYHLHLNEMIKETLVLAHYSTREVRELR